MLYSSLDSVTRRERELLCRMLLALENEEADWDLLLTLRSVPEATGVELPGDLPFTTGVVTEQPLPALLSGSFAGGGALSLAAVGAAVACGTTTASLCASRVSAS